MPEISETTDYDPRFDRAQSIDGAKARYVEIDDYTLQDLELDLERLMKDDERM